MVRLSNAQRAIVEWGLESLGVETYRFCPPPERFLEEHAGILLNAGYLGALSTLRKIPVPTKDEIESLRSFRLEEGPSAQAALLILYRLRRDVQRLYAASIIVSLQTALPHLLAVETAYAYASVSRYQAALNILRSRIERIEPEAPTIVPTPSPDVAEEALAFLIDQRRRLSMTLPSPPTSTYSLWTTPAQSVRPPPWELREVDLEWLARIGSRGGPVADDALELLRSVRGTALGVRALRHILAARVHGPLPEPIRQLCAEMFVELGYHIEAGDILADVPVEPVPLKPTGVDVDTPVTEENAAERVAQAEVVLSEDLERLGVRERRDRWAAIARGARLTAEEFQKLGGRSKLVVDGQGQHYVFGDEVTIGRADTSIVVSTPLMSRTHLRVRRDGQSVVVEDLGSHNGTWVDGARISQPIRVDGEVRLMIANEIPCIVRRSGDDPPTIEIGGRLYVAPLAPLSLPGVTD